jgi:hypothetical protein
MKIKTKYLAGVDILNIVILSKNVFYDDINKSIFYIKHNIYPVII